MGNNNDWEHTGSVHGFRKKKPATTLSDIFYAGVGIFFILMLIREFVG